MSVLRDLLSPIPQAPEPHPEGSLWNHSQLVRRSLDAALDLLVTSQEKYPSLSELDFNLTDEEIDIARGAGWLHDIGKVVTTTLNVGDTHLPYSKELEQYAEFGRWQALEHERPNRYTKALRKLRGTIWEQIWNNITFEAKKDLFFCIRYHMGLGHGDSRLGFGRHLSRKMMAPEGKYKNKRRYKLLLVIVCMDRLGRTVPDAFESANDAIKRFEDGARFVVRSSEPQSVPAPNNPAEFLYSLRAKPEQVVAKAFRGKFGREVTPQELEMIR